MPILPYATVVETTPQGTPTIPYGHPPATYFRAFNTVSE